jgi:hypothetical protein
MKALLIFAVIVIAVALAAGVLLTPLTTNMEAQAERARAARIAEETRLEQARAETVTAQADAFGLKTMAMLPWGLLILGGMFVGSLLVILAFRPSERMVDTLGQLPPQIGQRPIYFVQGPNESPEAFMMRVAMQMRQIEAPERLAR